MTVARALSGTFGSAQAAATVGGAENVTVFDSRTVSLGLGMLLIRAHELAGQGLELPDLLAELNRVRDQSGLFVTFDTFENLLRSGRIGRAKAWLGSLLDVKPILGLDRGGQVIPIDRVRGRDALLPRVIELLDERLTPRPRRLRLGIVHANAPEVASRLYTELTERFGPTDCLVALVTAVIGVHAGPGAWGVFYQVED